MSTRRFGSPSALLAGAALAVIALSCGEVPTLPGGVAYISPVILPSPAVAYGDTLRDSLGVVTPLKLYAIDNEGDTVPSTPLFVVTTIPGPSVHLTPANLAIGDSVRTAQIVGQVGTRLQTPPALLEVVRQPDSLAASTATNARFPAPTAGAVASVVPLEVSVTSPPIGTPARAGVKAIIVRYAVTRIFPASAAIPDTTLVLIDDSGRFLFPTGRTSVDTTDAAGSGTRQIRAIPLGFDSVEVSVTANNLRGIPLRGSPIRFVVTTK
ncbi:MAG TPA: hypothetical protein VJT85_08940 [Gemmatimonadaceae bacterium]|nr:hypothetical protein [Gemmatimonadaceae bacterium]